MTNKTEKFSFFSGFGNIEKIDDKFDACACHGLKDHELPDGSLNCKCDCHKNVKYQEPITLYDFTIRMDEFEKYEKAFGIKELKKSLRYDFSERCVKNLLETYKQYKQKNNFKK